MLTSWCLYSCRHRRAFLRDFHPREGKPSGMKPPVYSIGFFWQRSNAQCEVACLFCIALPALRRQGEGDHAIQEQHRFLFLSSTMASIMMKCQWLIPW
ncbi:hypothetical protein BDP67DRAFT_624799 [Colletotrichum lupini]|nr:hypothetical protein BDP67DRAFT_624799 [Colletotrichum lupini]